MVLSYSKHVNTVLDIIMEYALIRNYVTKILIKKLDKNLFLMKQNGIWTIVGINW